VLSIEKYGILKLGTPKLIQIIFKHSVHDAHKIQPISVIKTYASVLKTEIIAIYSETHILYKNTLWGQNAEFWNVSPGGARTND
jgi:hypothetical protein